MFERFITLLVLTSLVYMLEVESFKSNCFSASPLVCGRESGKLRRLYNEIDEILKISTSNEDPDQMMEVIEDWIERDTANRLDAKGAPRLDALIQLHSLVQTDGPGRCTLSSSRILQNNDLALRGAISKLKPGEIPKRKIERLVNYYAIQFEKVCDPEIALEDMDPMQLDYVIRIVGDYVDTRARDELPYWRSIPEHIVEEQPYVASNFAKNMRGIRRRRDSKVIWHWLNKLASGNSDPLISHLSKVNQVGLEEPVIDALNLGELYFKYVIEPCGHFTEKVESTFENKWALRQLIKTHKRLDTHARLYKRLTYYYGCRLLMHNETKMIAGLKALVYKSLKKRD